MDPIVAAIWIIMLIVTVVVVVPVALQLLVRTLTAARNIERYTAEMLEGGVGIAKNTENVAALKTTISVAGQLLAGADSIGRHTATAEAALMAKVPGNGQVKQGEA